MAQLVQRSLPLPEGLSSNLVIGKIYIEHFLLSTVGIEKTKIDKKRAGMARIFEKTGRPKNVHLA